MEKGGTGAYSFKTQMVGNATYASLLAACVHRAHHAQQKLAAEQNHIGGATRASHAVYHVQVAHGYAHNKCFCIKIMISVFVSKKHLAKTLSVFL